MSVILKQKLIDIANGFTKYGLWKGGGSGGSSALSEMTDVTFTNLQANDVLKYNGSVWVNDDNLHEYSTEEKVIGKWIDGKRIYEKVIAFTATLISSKWIDTPELIDDKNLIIQSFVIGKNICMPIIGSTDSVPSNYVRVWSMRKTNINIDYLIIQYTKTTD